MAYYWKFWREKKDDWVGGNIQMLSLGLLFRVIVVGMREQLWDVTCCGCISWNLWSFKLRHQLVMMYIYLYCEYP